MKLIFLLGTMLAMQDLINSISEDRINRIKDAYRNDPSALSDMYNRLETNIFPLRYYSQVPEIRPHLPREKFKAEIMTNPITVSLDGKDEFTVHSHIKYTVFSNRDKPFDFYMIITWPNDNTSDAPLLRLHEYESDGRKTFLPRSAIDAKLLRMTYNTEKKQKGIHRILVDILEANGGPKEECRKALLTTGIDLLKSYYILKSNVLVYPTVRPYSLVLDKEEVYVILGELVCYVNLTDHYASPSLNLKYILIDAVRGWVLIKHEGIRNMIFEGEEKLTIDTMIDDRVENI